MYVTYSDYLSLYGEKITEETFNILAFDACKVADKVTAGVDGIRKLKVAFPTDEDDAETVKRAICGVIDLMAEVSNMEKKLQATGDYSVDIDGNIRYKVIDSVSDGSESIHYAVGTGSTLASTLVADYNARKAIYLDIMKEALRGARDDNGVNLLFAGMYPME